MAIDSGVVKIRLLLDKKSLISDTKNAARAAGRELSSLKKIYSEQTKSLSGSITAQQKLLQLSKDLPKQERLKLLESQKSLKLQRLGIASAKRQVEIEQSLRKAREGATVAQRKALRGTHVELKRIARIQQQLERKKLDMGFAQAKKDVVGMSAGMKAAQLAARGMGLAIKGALIGSGIGVAVVALGTLAKIVGSIAGAPVVAVKAFSELNASLSMLSSVTGQSMDQLKPLIQEVKSVGGSSTKTANEVAQLATAYSRLGFTAEETRASLAGVVAINEAGGSLTDLETTASQVGGIIDSFKLAADESGRVGDILVTAANSSATDLGKLGDSFDRVRGNASAFSQTVESTALALGVFANQGDVTAERAAESYSQALVKIKAAAGDIKDVLGVEVFDTATGDMRQLSEIAKDLAGELQGLNDSDMADVLSAFIPDVRSQKSLIKLINGFDEANEKTQLLEKNLLNSKGALDKAVATFRSSNAAQVAIIRSAVDATAISFGESLQPATDAVLRSLGDIAGQIAKNTGLFVEIGASAQDFADKLRAQPGLVDAISDNIEELISKGLDVAVERADQLIEFLSDDDAVDGLIEGMEEFTEGLKGAIELANQLLGVIAATGKAAGAIGEFLAMGDLTDGDREWLDSLKGGGSGSGVIDGPGISAAQGGTNIKVTRTGDTDEEGLEILRMDLVDSMGQVLDTVLGNSGVASTQNFSRAGSRNSAPGSLAPIPTGSFGIGAMGSSDDPGVDGFFIPLDGSGDNQQGRGAFGIHADANRIKSPGSAGCIVLYDPAAESKVKEWLSSRNAPRELTVSYSTVPLASPSTGGIRGGAFGTRPAGRTGQSAAERNAQSPYAQRQRAAASSGTRWNSVERAADMLGVPAEDLAAMMSFETGGTLSPGQWGGDGGEYLGLIQFSPDNQKTYGVNPNQSFDEQLFDSVVPYLQDRGVTPGMDLTNLYASVLAGQPHLVHAMDSNGTTATNATPRIRSEHVPNALAVLGGPEGYSGGGGSRAQQYLSSQADEDAEKEQREAERAREAAEREALNAAKEARAAAERLRSETDRSNDMARDAQIRETRAAEDLAIAQAQAENPNSELVQEVTSRAGDRLSAYRKFSDEIETNNRAARDLRNAITDEQSTGDVGGTTNTGVIQQYERQLQQLHASNDSLRAMREQELALLDLKYESISAEEMRANALQRSAELTEAQRNGQVLGMRLQLAETADPYKQLQLETEQALLEIENSYTDTFEEIRQRLLSLTAESDSLQAIIDIDPSAQDALDEVNAELEHLQALMTQLGENRGLEQALAQVDLAQFEMQRKRDFREELGGDSRDAQLRLTERDGGVYARRRQERELGARDILGENVARMQSARDIFGAGSPEFKEIAAQIQRIADADMSELIQQTQTLGDELKDALGEELNGALKGLITGTETLGETLSNLAGNLSSMLFDMAMSGIGGGGGVGGWIMSLFGAGGHIPGTSLKAQNAYGGHIPNAAGGNVGGIIEAAVREGQRMPAGAGLMMANTSEAVLNRGQQAALANTLQSSSSAGGTNFSQSISVHNHSGAQGEGEIQGMGKELERAVLQIVQRNQRPGKPLYKGGR